MGAPALLFSSLLLGMTLAAGPVARIFLPHRISSGTHACWADAREIDSNWPGLAANPYNPQRMEAP